MLQYPYSQNHQVWFTSFSVDYAINPIMENVLDTLL